MVKKNWGRIVNLGSIGVKFGEGYPGEILSKIGEPYLRSLKNIDKNQSGLGLGIFIGKNLLEKNFASLNCQNSKTRTGAEVNIRWKNQDLKKI